MVLVLIALAAIGLDPVPALPTTAPATQASADSSLTVRDPTAPQAALKQALDNLRPNAGRGHSAPAPQVFNRGLVIVSGQPVEGLIEVQGAGIFFVREGSVISAGSPGDDNTVMRVIHLSSDGIEIEIASQKQRLILR